MDEHAVCDIDDEHLYHLAVHFLTPIKSRTARSTAKQLSRLNETTVSFPRLSTKKFSKKALVALRLPQTIVLKYLKSFADVYLHLAHVDTHVERDLYDDHLTWLCSIALEYKLRIPRLRHQGFQECSFDYVRHVAFDFERNDKDPHKYELVNIAYDTYGNSSSTSARGSWARAVATLVLTALFQVAYSLSLLLSLNTRIQPALPASRLGEPESSSVCSESVFAPESRSESLILELKNGLSTISSFFRLFGLAFVEFQREVKSLTWLVFRSFWLSALGLTNESSRAIKQSILLAYQCTFALMVGSSYADVPIVRETRPLEEDDDWQDFDWQSPFLARPEHRSMYTPPSIVKTPSTSPTMEKKRVSFSFPSRASGSVALRPPLERNRHMYETLLRHDHERAVQTTLEEEEDDSDNSSADGFGRSRFSKPSSASVTRRSTAVAPRTLKSPPLQRSFELQDPPERYRHQRDSGARSIESQLGLEGLSGPALGSPATDVSDSPSLLFPATSSHRPPSIESSAASDDYTPETSPEASISQLPALDNYGKYQAADSRAKVKRKDGDSVRRRKKTTRA